MISLHSCFVAGLTLVYCIWRDRSLFNYDTLEATRDCSQSLTIFGEKWPGAVKYRDIFDALSGNLLKTVFNPKTAPLTRIDSAQGILASTAPGRTSRTKQAPQHHMASQNTDSTMGHMVSDAVGVGVALSASYVATLPASSKRTFRLHRAEILAALANAVVLLGVCGYLAVEGVRRLVDDGKRRQQRR